MDILTSSVAPSWKGFRLGQLFHERKTKVSDKDYEPLSVTMKGIVTQLETAAKSNDSENRKLVLKGDYEPRRVCRRPFCLSHAAMSDCSSMA